MRKQKTINLVRILIIAGICALATTEVSKGVLGIFAGIYFIMWIVSIRSGAYESPVDAMSQVGPTLIRNLIGSFAWFTGMFVVFAIMEPATQAPLYVTGAMGMFAGTLCLLTIYPEVYRDEEKEGVSVF